MKNAPLAFLLFISIVSCTIVKTVPPNTENASQKSLQNGTYTVLKLYDTTITDSNPTIVLDMNETSISGFSGCNSYSCSYEKTEENITFTNPIATKRYCPEKPKLEDTFFKALLDAKKVHHPKGLLSFLDESGNRIIFAKIQ